MLTVLQMLAFEVWEFPVSVSLKQTVKQRSAGRKCIEVTIQEPKLQRGV
jgi:hypothetical protein